MSVNEYEKIVRETWATYIAVSAAPCHPTQMTGYLSYRTKSREVQFNQANQFPEARTSQTLTSLSRSQYRQTIQRAAVPVALRAPRARAFRVRARSACAHPRCEQLIYRSRVVYSEPVLAFFDAGAEASRRRLASKALRSSHARSTWSKVVP